MPSSVARSSGSASPYFCWAWSANCLKDTPPDCSADFMICAHCLPSTSPRPEIEIAPAVEAGSALHPGGFGSAHVHALRAPADAGQFDVVAVEAERARHAKVLDLGEGGGRPRRPVGRERRDLARVHPEGEHAGLAEGAQVVGEVGVLRQRRGADGPVGLRLGGGEQRVVLAEGEAVLLLAHQLGDPRLGRGLVGDLNGDHDAGLGVALGGASTARPMRSPSQGWTSAA